MNPVRELHAAHELTVFQHRTYASEYEAIRQQAGHTFNYIGIDHE